RLDPIVAAAISSGIVGQLVRELPNPAASSARTSANHGGGEGIRPISRGPHGVLADETSTLSRSAPTPPSNTKQTWSAASQVGGVPNPSQTLPNDSANSPPALESNALAWERDSFAAGLDSLLNATAFLDDPLGSASDHMGSGGGYADDDGLSLLSG